ncbi:hypothetical protein POM88_007046 [Heracleum sosnowskyi]|uniref:Uncharacterized protein n=1 Tax=Heracleum sosnowskyi TaxID=360622 RepID=A0AAD8J606_9APIA|nr:hypothetical protein POM88_007046 [Heracleum sosnowskyi]
MFEVEVVRPRVQNGQMFHLKRGRKDRGRSYSTWKPKWPNVRPQTSVKEAYGKLKSVFCKYSISFLDSTTVKEVDKDDYMIPMYKFQFVDFEDLDQYVKETPKDEKEELPEFAIDVIGAVEEMELVKKTTTKIGVRDVFRFKITDGSVRENEVTKIDGSIKCSECPRILHVAQKRYKVCILDGYRTEACNIVLLDKAIKRLLGISALKLIAELSKGKDGCSKFLDRINNFVGKEYTLNIKMNEDNILNGSSIYLCYSYL